MNKTRFTTKVLLSLLVVMVVLGSVAVVANAADSFQNYNLAYGEIVPTDEKLEAQRFTYSLSGDSDDLYFMRISKGKPDAYFAVEIYSDGNYQTQIRSYSKQYESTPGNKPLKITWEFKSVPSGTYYGRCYTFIEVDGEKTIDTASLKTFTINVDRISKKTVELKSLVNSATGPKITWAPFSTATQYYVYRRAAGEKTWTYLVTLGENASTYTDTTAKSGTYYAYTVKCREGDFVSLYNKTGLVTKYLATPVISVTANGAAGNAKVSWKAIDGANGYYVYRKGGSLSDYNWVLVANIKNGKTTYFVDTKATSPDWNYTYTVKAYSGNHLSSRNMNGIDFDYIPAPTLTKASAVLEGVQIEWKCDNTNVIKYNVYRKNGASWLYLGNTTEKTFIDTNAVPGVNNTYTVKAYSDINAGAYNNTGITVKYLAAPKLEPLTFDSNYRSIVKWEKSAGATGYKIYRKINDASSWYLVTTIKNGNTTTYYDSCKKASGNTYKYTVRAIDNNNVHSWFYPDGTVGVCLAKPLFTAQQTVTEDGSLCIETSWSAINGATNYNVYRRIPGGTWEALVRGTTELSYLDYTVECGVTYQYAVRALTDNGDISYFYTREAMAVVIPSLNSVTVTEEGAVLQWDAVENADLYTVYRCAKDSGAWENIGTTEANVFTDLSEESKTEHYYYTISATFGETESQFYDGLPNFIEIDITADFVAESEESFAYIDVDFACPDASSIEIYKTVNDEEPFLLEAVSGAFTDNGIEEGNTYTYTVVAFAEGKLSNSASATARYPYPPIGETVITNVNSYHEDSQSFAELTWDYVEFANEYAILRKYQSETEWTEVGSIPAQDGVISYTYTDTDILTEVNYDYAIKAISNDSERGFSISEPVTVYIPAPLDSVTGLKIENPEKQEDGTVKVRVSWEPTEYAASYNLYRKTADGDFELLYNFVAGTDLEYFDYIEANTEYTYKVEASAPDREPVCNEETFTFIDESAEPDVPVDPEEPDVPVVPEDPDIPGVVDPEDPDVPVVPDFPDTPGVPDEPVIPEDIPVGPTPDPDPDTPDVPVDPEDPVDPDAPVDPEETVENYITLVRGEFYFEGSDIIVTDVLNCEDLANIVVANEGYTIEATKENAYYGTGIAITVYKDAQAIKTYYLVVKTDVNGDGVCDVLDYQEIVNFNGGLTGFDDFNSIAADLNNDGSIDDIDAELFAELID